MWNLGVWAWGLDQGASGLMFRLALAGCRSGVLAYKV